jgi:hypothetical protein
MCILSLDDFFKLLNYRSEHGEKKP